MRSACLLVLAACCASQPALAYTAYALNVSGTSLLRFETDDPGTVVTRSITGLAGGETVVALDWRPRSRALYGVTSASRVVVVDVGSGVATPVGAAFTPALFGALIDIDFNPLVDRIRLVTDADQNLRLDPATGIATTDVTLTYAPGDPGAGANPAVIGAAYTNSFTGAAATTLYDIDAARSALVTQNPPNNGTLNTVGALGVTITPGLPGGLDTIRQTNGSDLAFAVFSTNAATSTLFQVNLATGAATPIGAVGTPATLVRGIAIRDESLPDAWVATQANQLVRFNLAAPAAASAAVTITGMQAGETVQCLAWRPATQQLLAVGTTERLYAIVPTTGAATPVGAGPFGALAGTGVGCAMNPVVDRLRVVSDAEENLRVNPLTGALAATDTVLAYAAGDPNAGADPNDVAVAYDNNYAGATVTTLYGVATAQDVLVVHNPPNAGALLTVGSLGIDVGTSSDLDIVTRGSTQTGFLVANPGAAPTSNLYGVNLATGATTPLGPVDASGATASVRAFAIRTDILFANGYE